MISDLEEECEVLRSGRRVRKEVHGDKVLQDVKGSVPRGERGAPDSGCGVEGLPGGSGA